MAQNLRLLILVYYYLLSQVLDFKTKFIFKICVIIKYITFRKNDRTKRNPVELREIQANSSKLLPKNKEKRKEYNKEYYKTYKMNPITCECGKRMLEKNLRFHIVTNYHTSRVKNKS